MKLNFVQRGVPQSSAPAVILLHGLFGSLSNLANTAKALASDFTTYQLDLRNHGLSLHDNEMSYACMAADVIEFMDEKSIEQAHLIGHSMGGKTAMQLALNHPERVHKLIIADIAPVTYPRHHNPALEGLQLLAKSTLLSRKLADELLAQHIKEAPVRAFLLKNLYRTKSGDYKLRLNLQAIVDHYQTMAEAPAGVPFTGPTLFLKGSDSAYIQNQYKDNIMQLFPAAKMKAISGTGHWLHSEKPDTFNRLVKQFLNN